jgi:hypothetical protein
VVAGGGLVPLGNGARRMAGVGELEARVHERAAAKPAAREPRLERRKRAEEAVARRGARLRGGREHAAGRLVARLEHGDDEVVLGGEVAVQRHLAHVRLGGDAIDAHGPNALPVEELGGCLQDAFAWGHGVNTSFV